VIWESSRARTSRLLTGDTRNLPGLDKNSLSLFFFFFLVCVCAKKAPGMIRLLVNESMESYQNVNRINLNVAHKDKTLKEHTLLMVLLENSTCDFQKSERGSCCFFRALKSVSQLV